MVGRYPVCCGVSDQRRLASRQGMTMGSCAVGGMRSRAFLAHGVDLNGAETRNFPGCSIVIIARFTLLLFASNTWRNPSLAPGRCSFFEDGAQAVSC